MDPRSVESERPRSSSSKQLHKCNRCQKLGHYPTIVVLHAQCLETLSEVIDRLPRRATDAGPTLLRSHNSVADRQKTVGVSRALRSTDPATSIEFANLLIRVAPDSQSLCVCTW